MSRFLSGQIRLWLLQVKEDAEAAMNIKQAETMVGTLRFKIIIINGLDFPLACMSVCLHASG